MGYTPAFEGGYHGTLCGRWPSAPMWFSLFPLVDRHGNIDMTYEAIHAVTGWPVDLLRIGIAQLMEPDPGSRSKAEDGRRLVLLDPQGRDWGWKVVNHSSYKEKARKAAYDAERAITGDNAARMAERRAKTHRDPPRPADTRPQTPDSDSEYKRDTAPEFETIQAEYPTRQGAQRWPIAYRACSRLVLSGVPWQTLLDAAKRYRVFMAATGKLGTEYVQQAATFYGAGAGWREPWDLSALPASGNGAAHKPAPTPEAIAATRADIAERQRIEDEEWERASARARSPAPSAARG